jgi:hypothetical protein
MYTKLSLSLMKGDPIFIGNDLAIVYHGNNRVSLISEDKKKIVRYKAYLKHRNLNENINEDLFDKVLSLVE